MRRGRTGNPVGTGDAGAAGSRRTTVADGVIPERHKPGNVLIQRGRAGNGQGNTQTHKRKEVDRRAKSDRAVRTSSHTKHCHPWITMLVSPCGRSVALPYGVCKRVYLLIATCLPPPFSEETQNGCWGPKSFLLLWFGRILPGKVLLSPTFPRT